MVRTQKMAWFQRRGRCFGDQASRSSTEFRSKDGIERETRVERRIEKRKRRESRVEKRKREEREKE